MHVGPRTKPAERVKRAHLDVIPAVYAAPSDGDREDQPLIAVRRDARGGARGRLGLERHFEAAALERGFVAQHEMKLGVRAGECVALEVHVDAQSGQVAVTVMHGDQRERHHEECEREGEVAVVVERGDEHGRKQRRQREAEARRQDVDAPAVDGQRKRIRAVAARVPGT